MNKHEIKKITNGVKSSAKYYGVKCYKKMPKWYTEIKGGLTAHKGAIWACNGETILSGKRKKCFVLENWFRKELANKEDNNE